MIPLNIFFPISAIKKHVKAGIVRNAFHHRLIIIIILIFVKFYLHNGKDSNPHHTVLETAALPIRPPLYGAGKENRTPIISLEG